MSDTAIIVPINLQVLSIASGNSPASSGGARLDYTQLPFYGGPAGLQPPLAATVQQDLTQTALNYLPPGLHMHWALPGALTTVQDWSGLMGGEGTASALPAPDTWLVIRLYPGGGNPPLETQVAVVTSAYVGSYQSTALPKYATAPVLSGLNSTNPTPYCQLGGTWTYQAYCEQQAQITANSASQVTALGHGVMNFAGYYPDCFGLFGFCDAAPAPEAVGYLVVGWHADPANDPLYNGGAGRTVGDVRQWLNWDLAGAADSALLPARSVYAGMVSGVTPNGKVSVPPEPAQIAVGNSITSAVSTLLGALGAAGDNGTPTPQDVAQVLMAFLNGRLDLVEALDGTAQLEDLVHALGFHATLGESLSVVEQSSGAPGACAQQTVPPDVLQALLALNDQELTVSGASDLVSGLRQQLFLDWQNYLTALYQGNDPTSWMAALVPQSQWAGAGTVSDGPTPPSLSDYLTAAIATQSQQAAALTAAAMALDSACSTASQPVEGQPTITYSAGAVTAPPMVRPQDPAFALSGQNLEAVDRIGGSLPGNGTALPIRLGSQIAISTTATGCPTPIAATTLLDQSRVDPQSVVPSALSAAVLALCGEAALIDPQWASLQLGTLGNVGTLNANTLAGWLQQVFTGQAESNLSFLGGNGDTAVLPATEVACTAWQTNPWLPMFLAWKVQLQPYGTSSVDSNDVVTYGTDTVTGPFTLQSGDTELELATPALLPGSPWTFSGMGLLSANTSTQLSKLLNDGTLPLPGEVMQTIQSDLTAMPIHVGTLAGLFDLALQVEYAPQLPPVDLLSVGGDPGSLQHQAFTQAVATTLLATPAAGLPAAPGPLLPIVNGAARFVSLTVIDCFGQQMALTTPQVLTDATLEPPPAAPSGTQFWLPPRLAQPARLLARWLVPGPDDTSLADNPVAPHADPIRGWVLRDSVNGGLLLFDMAGNGLALVFGGNVGDEFSWLPMPGSPLTGVTATTPDDFVTALGQVAGMDAVYAAFIGQVIGGGPAAVTAFLGVLGVIEAEITPANAILDPGGLVLTGRPLAVVQASIGLSLQGGGAADQSPQAFNEFAANLQQQTTPTLPLPRPNMGVEAVKLPVLVGDDGRQDDGLYGYVLGDTFYASAGSGDIQAILAEAGVTGGIAPASPAPLTLTPGGDAASLTMLVDPAAPVHLATGLLPVVTMSIPTAFYRAALQGLGFSVFCAPVLTGDPTTLGSMGVLAPALPGTWSWSQCQSGTWSTSLPVKAPGSSILNPGAAPTVQEGWLTLSPPSAAE